MNSVGRILLPLLTSASVLGVCSTPTIADEAPPPIYTSPSTQLIAIAAWGPQADLDRLQAFARKSGFPSKQITDAPEGREVFVVFPPGSDASAVATFLDRLRGGEFSTLQFGPVAAPVKE
jgi:hypothetical protein